MALVAAHGIELDQECFGPPDGPPLVLIRGLGTQRIQWPPELLDALVARGLYVVTFDNRDVGLSSKLDHLPPADPEAAVARALAGQPVEAAYPLEAMVQDVVGLLDALDIASAHVAGISLGGMIVQLLALQHPERVRSAVPIMTSTRRPGLPPPTPEAAAALMARPEDPGDRESVVRTAVASQRVIGSPGFPVPDAVLRRNAEAAFDRCHHPAGVARQMLAVQAREPWHAELAGVTAPTLVIHGTDDPLIPPGHGEDVARCIPGATLRLVEGMGHDVVAGSAPLLAEAIAEHALATEALDRTERGG